MKSSVPMGQSMSVDAEVTGNPPPRVTWTFNEEDVSKSGMASVSSDGDKHALTIEDASINHHGTYTIEAINEGGKDISRYLLLVSFSYK